MDVERYPELGRMGVAAVVDQVAGVVMIDSKLSHAEAVAAIQHVLPDVPVDAVEHWVERELPTVEPLASWLPIEGSVFTVNGQPIGGRGGVVSTLEAPPARTAPPPQLEGPARPNRAQRRRHARMSAPRRVVMRTVSALGTTAIGAIAAAVVLAPTGAVADAWDDPIFQRVATAAELQCTPLVDEPLRAQCVDARGMVANAEAWVGPDSITYTFTANGERTVLKVFSSDTALRRWTTSSTDRTAYPNLATGDRVVLYGSDPEMLAPFEPMFTGTLTAEKVAPVVLRASYAMGLLPEGLTEQATAADSTLVVDWESVRNTPAPVQAAAAAILAGDGRLASFVDDLGDGAASTPDPVVPTYRAAVAAVPPAEVVDTAPDEPTAEPPQVEPEPELDEPRTFVAEPPTTVTYQPPPVSPPVAPPPPPPPAEEPPRRELTIQRPEVPLCDPPEDDPDPTPPPVDPPPTQEPESPEPPPEEPPPPPHEPPTPPIDNPPPTHEPPADPLGPDTTPPPFDDDVMPIYEQAMNAVQPLLPVG